MQIANLTKRYKSVTALNDVSFDIRQGEILGLIGPNGSGKTTLFECLGGTQPADNGSVSIHGRPLTPKERSDVLFYLPDGILPWPAQSVRWVLQFTLGYFGGRRHLYEEIIDTLALGPFLGSRIGALSKGQRKRVLLAIGLLTPQPLLLADEPFEGLDLRQTREVASVLRAHAAEERTMLLSIHQISDAARVCDRFVLLSGGKVCAEGTPPELLELATLGTHAHKGMSLEEVFLALT